MKPQPLRVTKEHVTKIQLALQSRHEILSKEGNEINDMGYVNLLVNLIIEPLVETAGDWKEIPTKSKNSKTANDSGR